MASTVNHVIAPHNPVIINGLQVFSPTNASDISTPTDDDSVTPSSIKSEPVDTGYDTGTSTSKTQVPQLQIIAPDNAPCTMAPSTPAAATSIIQGTRLRQAVTYIVKNPTSQTVAGHRTTVAAPVAATSVVSSGSIQSKRQVVVPTKTVRTSVVQQGSTPRPVFLVPSMATATTRTTPVYISQSTVASHRSDTVVALPKPDQNNVVCGLVYNSRPQDGGATAPKRKEYLCNFCFFRNENYTTLSNHLATHIFTCNHCPFKAFTRHEVITHKQKKHVQFPVDLHSTINAQINVGLSSMSDTANNVTVTMSRVSAMPSTLGVVKSIVVTSTMTNVTQTSSQSVLTGKPTVAVSGPVSEVTSSTAASSPNPDRAMADKSKNSSYFTYKIHEYSERETMYECDICLYMTKELYDMYDHATTHNIGASLSSASVDSVTDTPGLIWECLYCSFRVEKQSVLVTHIKSAHVGKTLKMRRQWVAPSTMVLPPAKDVPPPKKATPVPSDTHLLPVTSDGTIDTQATLWGCYYCSSFHTFDRSAAISHVQTKHKGHKLMITRRRVVSTSGSVPPNNVSKTVSTTKQNTSGSNSTTEEGKSRRKQPLATSRTVLVSKKDLEVNDQRLTVTVRQRKPSKYDSMIAFLNHSNEMIRQQINEIDSAVALSVPGGTTQSGVTEMKSEKLDDAELPSGSSLVSLRKAAEQADTVHLSKLPDDLKIDWQKYFTIDRAASIAKCLKCSHESSGKHAFSHMRVHITVHTLERLWGCPYCDHRSSRRIFMYKHVVSQHAGRPVLLVRRRPYRVPSGPASRRLKIRNGTVDLLPTRRLQGPRSVREAKVLKDATDMFVCPSCSRSSVFRGNIRTHIKFVHPESNPQNLHGEVVLRPPAMPSDGVVTPAHMKTASVHLVRLEDVPKFAVLKKIIAEKGEMLHHDLDINEGADEESMPMEDTTEMLVLPNSSELGKYGCPYCVYKTFRPLVVKQHILYRHPDDEIKVCDLRVGGSKRSKFLYPCALLSCQFLTPMKEALYAHIGKNPLHVGNTVTETLKHKDKDKGSSDDEPIAKIATRCSSLRSASLKNTPTEGAVDDDGALDGIFSATNDPVLVQFISDLKGGAATPRLLLKCRYCDLPSSYDPVTIKDHLISEHPRWDPVVLDVKARFYRQESRLYMCPLLSCDFMTYTSREFVSHLKRVHTDMQFLLPVINRHARKTKSCEHQTKGTKRKHVHSSKSDGCKKAKTPQIAKTVSSSKVSYPYLCFYCKASCDDRRSVKEHLLEHHPCEYWFICFSEKARIDHKKSKMYLCKSRTCDFFSHSLDDYDSHPCVVEERASVAAAAPPAHSGGNSPEKMYQCSYCTSMMTNVHDIRAHVKTEHKSSSGGYTEIQTGFGKNGTIVMNVNSEVTCQSTDHLDKNGISAISSSDVESSDISNFASPESKRTTEQNGSPALKHTEVGIDSVSSQVEDMHTKLNAVMEALHRKKHERSQKAEDKEATESQVGKLPSKLSNNIASGSTEDKVGDAVTSDGESDVDMTEAPKSQSPLSTCVNGQGQLGDGDKRGGSSEAQDTETSESTRTKSQTQGKDDTLTPRACPSSKDPSDRDEGEVGSDSREAASDSASDNGQLGSVARRGCEDGGQPDVLAGGETNCGDTETSDTVKAAGGDDHAETSEVTEQQGGDGKTVGGGEINRDTDPPHPPVTISIKIPPPKAGWKDRRSGGSSSSSSDSTDDDSGESDQEDDDVDSSDTDNSDSDSSSD
ncbi:hypothetical protein NP493_859g01058 [Ridgeia piscesae]|uniref:C2H2-type domain-containing protein n=1 Tax=Ridgeia piscesae TaxID=27915 RepID=A0AAD9KM25_RIDPI|nr:hypothetical protein NP493_859g01058 [Ridgeia piscesae]